MHWILTRLRDSRAPLWRYVLRAYAIQFLPVVALGALLVILSGGAAVSGARGGTGGLGAFLGFVVFAPLVENLLMAGGLWLAARFLHTDVARAVAVAIPFGVVHLLAGAIGLLATWSFFVFAMAYLAWRPRSFVHAYGVSVLVHALANLVPGIAAAA